MAAWNSACSNRGKASLAPGDRIGITIDAGVTTALRTDAQGRALHAIGARTGDYAPGPRSIE
jgi:hypothetical protein